MKSLQQTCIVIVWALCFAFFFSSVWADLKADTQVEGPRPIAERSSIASGFKHRKLLVNDSSSARVGPGRRCTGSSFMIQQGQLNPLPNGIPKYMVSISCVCPGCVISDVHIDCGQWASTTLIDPAIFKRLNVGDCLLLSGNSFTSDYTITFTYTNSFQYPMSVSSFKSIC